MISFYANSVYNCKHIFFVRLTVYAAAGFFFISILTFSSGCSFQKAPTPSGSHEGSPASQLIRFYQGPLNHLAAVRHGGCPMHPNCSAYGLSAIEKHGALIGWMMTFDRLMRCGLDETRLSPEVLVDGRWHYIDTLEQNDFWWCLSREHPLLMDSQPTEQSLQWGIDIE